jgi:hypothetical protein
MSVREIKRVFKQVIKENADWDPYELRRLFTEAIREWEVEKGWSEKQKGEPWTDDELRAVSQMRQLRRIALSMPELFAGVTDPSNKSTGGQQLLIPKSAVKDPKIHLLLRLRELPNSWVGAREQSFRRRIFDK